jgi:O-acetyl-ADP-ribose deacetylase (regulator of RNase III)
MTGMAREKIFANGRKLRLVSGDITRIAVDAMANAANSALAGGGGVDGAIHDAGGPSIMAELDRIRAAQGGCPTGSAVATGAGRLPAKHVFHAVGPVYRGGKNGEAALLASCYETCLDLATHHNAETLSFPAISTGIFGYPVEEAAAIAIDAISKRLETKPGSVSEVVLVLFDARTYRIFERLLLE